MRRRPRPRRRDARHSRRLASRSRSLAFYAYVLRALRTLEPNKRAYYEKMARNDINQQRAVRDADRARALQDKGAWQVAWLCEKYGGVKPPPWT